MSDAPLMLSVSGLRGLVGRSLTPEVAARYGAAVGSWLKAATDKPSPRVVIGRDSRPSGELIEMAAASGLASVGCRPVLLGIVSTPGVAVMAKHVSADGGMVITASHNPIVWNGIKVIRADGIAPPADEAQQMIDRFHRGEIDYVAVASLGAIDRASDSAAVHVDAVLRHIDADAVRSAKLRCVVDSVHGAGGPEMRLLLDRLGVEVEHLWAEPTGRFPHTPEPTKENLVALCDAVKQHGADIGFAQDPDADRLAVVDEQGRYIGEEYTLALCAEQVLARGVGQGKGSDAQSVIGGDPALHTSLPQPHCAANLSTSRMIDDVAARHGGVVHRSAVGEANVATVMRQHGAVVGGEGNGGIIWPVVSHVRDSIVGAALLLEMLAKRGQALSQIVAAMPAYSIVKMKFPVDADLLASMASTLRDAFGEGRFDTQDGVRVDFDEAGQWVHVRASNTEPIVRVIAEASDEAAARALIDRTCAAIGLSSDQPGMPT